MRRGSRLRTGLAIGAVISVAGLTGCSNPGDLTFQNETSSDVTVWTGEEELEVSAWGGVSVLGAGCSDGDVTVTFASGQTIVVAGPVCPDRAVVVYDGRVALERP